MVIDALNPAHGMYLRQPAIRWQDALPCGNGTLGALLFGNVQRETVVLNHEALWLPVYERKSMPEMAAFLPRLRALLDEGKFQEAEVFWHAEVARQNRGGEWVNPFQPCCDLHVAHAPSAAFRGYSRGLDFTTGEAFAAWSENGNPVRRNLFVSRADGAVVLQIRGRALSGAVSFVPHPFEVEKGPGGIVLKDAVAHECSASEDGFLLFEGTHTATGGCFGAVARVVCLDGRMELRGRELHFSGAGEVLVLVKLFTPADGSAAGRLREELAALPADYEALRARHAELHGALYQRVKLDLRDASLAGRCNEEILLDAYGGETPAALMERMFNFSRYLLISSSGAWPANLQGIWNGDWSPPWCCDYTMDENIEMAYWQALPGGMPELMESYFSLWESQYADWRENARALFGCRGVLAPIKSSTCGVNQHVLPNWPWHFWTAGAGWLSALFYDYWLFTGDRDFLANRALPLLREIALFYEDFLVEGSDGRYVFTPSLSPENTPGGSACKTAVNSTMDVAVAKEALGNLIAACRELRVETDRIPAWEAMLRKMPEYQTNEDGALKEWLHPDLRDNYRHRHQSHVYAAFPGFEAAPDKTPALYEACRIAVEKRLVVGLHSQTSWSLAHMANLFARMRQPARAHECLELICRALLGPNLFTYHQDWRLSGLSIPALGSRSRATQFQLDANLGFSAAVMEMLLCSTPDAVLHLLPALPDAWPSGSISGICARGGFELDIIWENGALRKAVIRSKLGKACEFRYGNQSVRLETVAGREYALDANLAPC